MLRTIFARRTPDYHTAAASLEQHGIDTQTHQRLATFLASASDHELHRFNPRALAARLDLGEREVLRLLVAALYEGLVTLHWEVQCPGCGAIDHRPTSLTTVHSDTQCPACHMHYQPALDEQVRVTFSLHERLRPLPPAADDPQFRTEIDNTHGVVPGHALLALPLFRRLFPQERVPPDESLRVTRAALLFTDLAGSTAMYARRGDPRAYHLVRLHFDALFDVADRAGGTVVKTIGDAILGVFLDPVDALEAALAMHAEIAALNQRAQLEGDECLILKVGLHVGPCLSVTLNDRPDYFGTTVNLAARVQGLSRGGDIVFTEAMRADPRIQPLLADRQITSDEVFLKGIEEKVRVHRFEVSSET